MRSTFSLLGLSLVVAGAGCAPTIPFHATETADVLKAKQVAITVAGGGGDGSGIEKGAAAPSNCCGGGGVRVRVGVGHDQEVGAEMTAIGVGGSNGGDGVAYLAGKLRYKLGLGRHLAFLAGLGGAGAIPVKPQMSTPPLVLGADVALLASTSPLAGWAQVYGGLRFTAALPATSDFYANNPTELFTVPVGVALQLHPRWTLFLEGGLLGAVSEYQGSTDHSLQTYSWIGGYGAAAVQYTAGPL
jgi:hypothetical protein